MRPNRPFCDPSFLALLSDFDLDQLESENGTIYGLWPDLTLAYASPQWTRFAAENGGEPAISTDWKQGRCILDAIADPLRPFFVENFASCLRESCPWEHKYECSSAVLYRQYLMTAFPLGHAEGLMVVHSLLVETAHTRTSFPPLEDRYVNEDNLIHQCCHCRRVQRSGEQAIWDWVPDWVRTPRPDTSHGICPACLGFDYAPARFAKAFSSERLSRNSSNSPCSAEDSIVEPQNIHGTPRRISAHD